MKTHLFCNAHLDPVWLWRWDEGMAEALATFRSAADLIDEYPGFIFNHNESLLYEWVEEHEPELFERIKKHVANGRWEIVGGWFLQPDCNIPSGEALTRQAVKGMHYFHQKFDKLPVTAINFDAFGHARGLVQILAQCGYRHSVCIRPGKEFYDFPNEDFIWKGYDGSEVIMHRSNRGYNSIKGKAAELLTDWVKEYEGQDSALFLWGVGNHGGGPSRKDLSDIAELINSGMDVVHSTPDAYFAELDKTNLPVVSKGLNPVFEGCYTSQIRVKQLYRRLENDLIMTEKMASHAALCGLSVYEKEKVDDAWWDLLFAAFHDALPGTGIVTVEEDTIRQLNHGLEICSKLKTKYFIALAAGQEKLKDEETVPLLVYNPHPFTVKQNIDAKFVLPKQIWTNTFSNPVAYQNGKKLPSQSAQEDGNFYMDWCKRVIFEAELPPTSMSRFDILFEQLEKRPAPTFAADACGKFIIETARGRVEVNERSGLVDSYVVDGIEYLKSSALSFDIIHDMYSPWGNWSQTSQRLDAPVGSFSPMTAGQATDFAGVKSGMVKPVRTIEEGEVRVVIEADMQYNDSKLCVFYIVNKQTGILDIEARVFFGEKERRLKMTVPSALDNSKYYGQTVYGREELNAHRGDDIAHCWTAIANDTHALTIINDGVYGSDFDCGTARMTLLHSVGYGAANCVWGDPFQEPTFQPRMEQGERYYRFKLQGGTRADRLGKIDREAAVFNQLPYSLQFCPTGYGKSPLELVALDKENVSLSCFKRCELDENAYILRIFESQGIETQVKITIPCLGLETCDTLQPFEIKTFRVCKSGIEVTTMLEGLR